MNGLRGVLRAQQAALLIVLTAVGCGSRSNWDASAGAAAQGGHAAGGSAGFGGTGGGGAGADPEDASLGLDAPSDTALGDARADQAVDAPVTQETDAAVEHAGDVAPAPRLDASVEHAGDAPRADAAPHDAGTDGAKPPSDAAPDAPTATTDASADRGADAPTGIPKRTPTYLSSLLVDSMDSQMFLARGDDGSMYVAGGFDVATDLDPTAGTDVRTPQGGSWNGFVTKVNADGSRAWTRAFGGVAGSFVVVVGVAVTRDGVFVSGRYSGTVDLDPGSATFSPPGTGSSNPTVFVERLTFDGTFVWASTFAPTTTDPGSFIVVMNRLEPGADGSVYLTGFFSGTVDFDPGPGVDEREAPKQSGYLVKVNPATGKVVWVSVIGGQPSCNWDIDGVTEALDGGVWMVGATDEGCGAFGSTAPPGSGRSLVLMKMNAAHSGGNAWFVSGIASPQALARGPDGSIFVAGTACGLIDFDPGPGMISYSFPADASHAGAFLLKLGADASYKWVVTKDLSAYHALAVAPGGAVLAVRSPALGVAPTGPMGFWVDAFEADSTPAWSFSLSSTGTANANDLLATPTTFFVSGINSAAMDLDPGPYEHDSPAAPAAGPTIGSSFVAAYRY